MIDCDDYFDNVGDTAQSVHRASSSLLTARTLLK